MSVLHISEAEAVRDFASVMAHVRAGSEVIIESEDSTIAAHLVPPLNELGEPEPGHDQWFRSEVQMGLDCDPATDLDEEEAAAHFAQQRRSLLKRLGESE